MNTVVMPKMGDTMEEGKILNWLKQEGDTIEKGEAIAEIETEKVNIEAEAFAAGVLRKILAPVGATIPVGQPIAYIGAANEPIPGESAPSAAGATSAQPSAAAGAAQGASTATRPAATTATASTPLIPATPASGAGASAGSNGSHGANGSNGSNGSHGANGSRANGSAGTAAATTGASETASGGGHRLFISPIARRIAVEHGLDISTLHGTGPGGRIIRDDVEAALTQQESGQFTAPQLAAITPETSAPAGQDVVAQPLTAMRKTIARRLQQSMQAAPHFYVTTSVDATRLGEFRASVNEFGATLPQPVKISFNDLIVKAVATALTHMPEVNVSFDNDQILLKRHINIGIAVALEQGLIVPVIRDADQRGVLDIARESRRLVDAARQGKLKPDDIQGGTFSISNLGMFEVESFTAVINPPEAAILAVGAITPTPVVRDGQIVVRDIMKMTLSSDHRALDGAIAARFLHELKTLLEQPLAMLL